MYKRKKKKTELSSQIPFSYPSALPNGFSLISSRREVKSKTKTNRVHWCVVRSALIGEFQDLPLRLVVNPAPPTSYLCFPRFLELSIVALRSNLSILGLPPGESQLSHIRPPFSLNGSLKVHL